MSLTIKQLFVFIFFAENRPCCENFKCGLKITCTKRFFAKLHGRFLARQYNIFFFTIISIAYKIFSILFSVFCFILFVKCFQGLVFSPANLVKKNAFYRVTKGDLLIEKGIRFCKSQLPDVNLYLIFSLVITVYFQSLLRALLPT